MRSLHIIGSRRFGGAERFFVRLVSALARRGEEVMALLQPNSELAPALDPQVARRMVRMRSVFDVLARTRINAAVKAFNADLVQTYMGRATRLTHIRARRRSHGRRPLHIARLGGYYDVKGYQHADAWIANAHGIRDHLVANGLPAERVFYIGNFVDPSSPGDPRVLDALRRDLGVDGDTFTLVCLGRLHRNKAFDVMLDAFARLPATIAGRRPRLIVVGDGPEATALEAQARTLALGDRVRFTGWQTAPEPYLQIADLFVCPSRHEPLGNVVLEAWNEQVPVLATRTGGPAELIEDRVNGRLVPPDDADALAGAIVELLDADPGQRRQLVAGGTRRLAEDHSEQVVVDAYLALYASLLAGD